MGLGGLGGLGGLVLTLIRPLSLLACVLPRLRDSPGLIIYDGSGERKICLLLRSRSYFVPAK